MSENINGFDVEDAQRFRLKKNGDGYYVTLGEQSIMFHGPNEGGHLSADLYGITNATCRTASKARKAGVSWDAIASQWEKAGGGNERLIVSELARVVRAYAG